MTHCFEVRLFCFFFSSYNLENIGILQKSYKNTAVNTLYPALPADNIGTLAGCVMAVTNTTDQQPTQQFIVSQSGGWGSEITVLARVAHPEAWRERVVQASPGSPASGGGRQLLAPLGL